MVHKVNNTTSFTLERENNTIYNVFISVLKINPLKKNKVSNNYLFSVFYFLIIRTLYFTGVCLLNLEKIKFKEFLISFCLKSLFLFFVCILFSFILSYYTKLGFSNYLLILYISTCTYYPLIKPFNVFIPEIIGILIFGAALLQIYYFNASISTVYTVVDQKDATILNVIEFITIYIIAILF